jgi:hypothetical protein
MTIKVAGSSDQSVLVDHHGEYPRGVGDVMHITAR